MARKNRSAYLEGFDELSDALRAVGDHVSGLLLRNAAEKGAEVIAEDMRSRVPRVDSPAAERYGHIQDHIEVQIKRLQQGRAQYDVGPGKDQFWAKFVELGTSKMPAHPFVRPAFDATAEEAAKAVEDALRAALRDVLS